MMYESYSFMFIPIIVGVLRHVPTCIFTNILEPWFQKKQNKKTFKKLKVFSVTGTVQICKTLMSLEVLFRAYNFKTKRITRNKNIV